MTRRMMDTAWLDDFLALIEEKGFARAALRRNVTQPAFSRRIQALEQWLDTPLFDRSTHVLQLTAAGEAFRPHASEVLRRLSVGRIDAQQAMRSTEQVLRFAVTQALAMTFFPAWLRQLEEAAALDATIQLTAGHMAACERSMLGGAAQFLLCHSQPDASSLLETERFVSVGVGEDLLVPVSAPESAGSRRAMYPVGPGKQPIPYLSYTEESGMGRILAATWESSGTPERLRPVFASHVSTVLIALARSGRGITWSPLSLAEEDLRLGRLVRAGGTELDVPLAIRLYRPVADQGKIAEALWLRIKAQQAA